MGSEGNFQMTDATSRPLRKFRSDPAFSAVIAFPKFKVGVATRDGRVTHICYLPPGAPEVAPRGALAERAVRQLERYREDPDTVFDLPLLVEGTALQKAVWQAMCAIPRGRTRTQRIPRIDEREQRLDLVIPIPPPRRISRR